MVWSTAALSGSLAGDGADFLIDYTASIDREAPDCEATLRAVGVPDAELQSIAGSVRSVALELTVEAEDGDCTFPDPTFVSDLAGDDYQGVFSYYDYWDDGDEIVYDGALELGFQQGAYGSSNTVWVHEEGSPFNGWDPATGALDLDLGGIGNSQPVCFDDTCTPMGGSVEESAVAPLSGDLLSGSLDCEVTDVVDLW